MKVEGIYTFDMELFGWEVLWDAEFVEGKKERFFGSLEESIDLEIFKRNLEVVKEKGLYFLNLKPSTLLKYAGHIVELISPNVVIELREDAIEEPILLQLVNLRRYYPFRLSLDDFGRIASNVDRLKLLVPQFVKIEVPLFTVKELVFLVNFVKSVDRNCKVVAEKVENESLFKLAKGVGFELWQGFYEKELKNAGTLSARV